MKTLITKKRIRVVGLATALAGVVLLGAALSGCSTAEGGKTATVGGVSSKPWLRFEPITSEADLAQLQPGDEIAMVCNKCKTVEVTRVMSNDSKGRIKTTVTTAEHQCPGCGAKLVAGSDKQTHMIHVCSHCGDTSAFCCATKRGGVPTKGMEQK